MIKRNAWGALGLLIALLLLAGTLTTGCDISPVPNPTAEADPGYGEEAGGETGFEALGEEDDTEIVPPGGGTGMSGSIEGGEDTNGVDFGDGGTGGGETGGEEGGGEETGGEEGQTVGDEEVEEESGEEEGEEETGEED